MPAGLLCIVAAVVLAVVLPKSSALTSLVVSSPAAGMVATAVGNGGANASTVEPGSSGLIPIKHLDLVPTTPSVYLKGRQLLLAGRPDGTGPAFWKVWWDGQSQVKTAVSLQQSVTTSDAVQGLAELNPTVKALYPNESPLSVPGVPTAIGYQWTGTDGTGSSSTPFELWAAMFQRGTNIALVSMKAYGSATLDRTTFLAFAAAEYAAMKSSKTPGAGLAAFAVLLLAGFAFLVSAAIGRMRRRRAAGAAAGAATPWGAPWPAPAAYAGPVPWAQQAPAYPGQQASSSGPTPWAVGPQPVLPPAGWYADPYAPAAGAGQGGSGQSRYWDGAAWTGHVGPAAPSGSPGGGPPPDSPS